MVNKKVNGKKLLALTLCILMLAGIFSGCAGTAATTEDSSKDRVITIADGGWASISFGTALVKYILEKGYGYSTKVVSEDEAALQADAEAGKIDIVPEFWMYDQKAHDAAKAANKIMDVRDAFIATDGLWVPAYVIKGDAAKGIKAAAPDLVTMQDLKKYVGVFKDPADPSKGMIQLGVEDGPPIPI